MRASVRMALLPLLPLLLAAARNQSPMARRHGNNKRSARKTARNRRRKLVRHRRSLPVAVNLTTPRHGVSMELFNRLSIYAFIYGKRNCFIDFLGVAYI